MSQSSSIPVRFQLRTIVRVWGPVVGRWSRFVALGAVIITITLHTKFSEVLMSSKFPVLFQNGTALQGVVFCEKSCCCGSSMLSAIIIPKRSIHPTRYHSYPIVASNISSSVFTELCVCECSSRKTHQKLPRSRNTLHGRRCKTKVAWDTCCHFL